MVVSPTEISADWRRCQRDFETWIRLEKGLAGNSVLAYLRDTNHLAEFFSERNIRPEQVTLDDLQQLLLQINDLGIAPTSQRRMISGWRMFFKHLVVEDAIKENQRVLLLDDVLATGGTMSAATKLMRHFNPSAVDTLFLIELKDLNGREKLKDCTINSLVQI